MAVNGGRPEVKPAQAAAGICPTRHPSLPVLGDHIAGRVHDRSRREAGYLEVRKGAVGRRPRTWFRLTAQGRRALEDHLAWLAQLEEAVSTGAREMEQAEPPPDDLDQPRRELPPLLGQQLSCT